MTQEIYIDFSNGSYTINDHKNNRYYTAYLPNPLSAQLLYNTLPKSADCKYKNIIFEKLADYYQIPKDRVFTVRIDSTVPHFKAHDVENLDYILHVIKNPKKYEYKIDYYSYNPDEGMRGYWPVGLANPNPNNN